HFFREVKAWISLDHPNILPFLGYSIESDGFPRLVSPWCENGDLQKYIRSHPEANRPQLLIDVLQGMRYVEGANLVHGDLKSANVLVNEHCRACLCDFGSTRMIEGASGFTTSSLNTKATLRFMSPERLMEDEPPTIASDVWAFGCIVVEVFTNSIPYAHIKNDNVVSRKITEKELPLDPSYDTTVSPGEEFWTFVGGCWEFESTRRLTISALLHFFSTFFSSSSNCSEPLPKEPLPKEPLPQEPLPGSSSLRQRPSFIHFRQLHNMIAALSLPPMERSVSLTGDGQWTCTVKTATPIYNRGQQHMVNADGELAYEPRCFVATAPTKQEARNEAARIALEACLENHHPLGPPPF
ncbi:hypothetical protein FRC03_010224, partial [Tulasnella sp. 419]